MSPPAFDEAVLAHREGGGGLEKGGESQRGKERERASESVSLYYLAILPYIEGRGDS